ncbi:MAG: hypothetical protein ACOYM1_11570 [Methylovulum sp.]
MSTTLLIGAKPTNADLIEKLASSQFPLVIKLTNHLPRNLSFPEVGLFLEPLTGQGTALIRSYADLARLISSLEQIAILNKHDHAVTLEELTPAPAAVAVAPAPNVIKEPKPKSEPKGDN